MTYKVIDVARYQKDIDWEKVKKSGVEGALLKTVSTNYSQFGGLYIDPYFEKNYAECKRLGIPVGAYYYTYAQDKAYADKELALFKQAVSGKTFELPLVVDVEDNLLRPLSADALTDLVEYAVKTIEGWGYYAMVYTYLNYQNTELNMTRLAKYDLWLAAYRDVRPTAPRHSIWQYSSKGAVSGINGNCDLNWAYKDYPTIIKNAGLNGFKKAVESKLSKEPCKLIIGSMSKGDIDTIGAKLTELRIDYTVTAEGYIITDKEVSYGDKMTVETKCNQLGNIEIKDLIDIKSPENKCEECDLLKLKVEELQSALSAEQEKLSNAISENEKIKNENNTLNKIFEDIKNIINKKG